jgi:tetratricopeptide (TPR) repeat protein
MLNNLGNADFTAHKYFEAEPLFSRAISLLASETKPSEDLAAAYHNLAAVYRAQARYSDSASLYQSALDLREVLAGPSDSTAPDITAFPLLNELGLVYLEQPDFVRAELAFTRALSIMTTHKAGQTSAAADAINNLAMAKRQQGRYAEAEDLYRQALAIYQNNALPAREVAAMNNLGRVLAEQHTYKEAEHLYRDAVALAERELGPSHPDTALGYSNLGKLLSARQKYADAEPLLKRAEQIDRKNFSEENPRIGYDLYNEAVAASGRKRYGDAETLYQESEAILRKALPANHPEIGKVMARRAEVYRLQGRLDESEGLFQKSLNVLERAWGPENPQLVSILQEYEALLRLRQEYAEAESVQVRTTRIRVGEALRNQN